MEGLPTYYRLHDNLSGEINFGIGIALSYDCTIDSLVSICVSLKFIDTWLKYLSTNFVGSCCIYQYKMKEPEQNHNKIHTNS